MKHILTIILCAASCLCYGQERRQTESREGWWNDNPSFVVPIREIGVTARRPMKEIGVQKTRLDTLVLHENIALSMADVLTFNTSIFVKQYGRATLSTVAVAAPLTGLSKTSSRDSVGSRCSLSRVPVSGSSARSPVIGSHSHMRRPRRSMLNSVSSV